MAAGVATADAFIAEISSAVTRALRLEAMRPSVEVRLWARPGVYSAKLCDDFDAFCSTVAAAAGVDRATIRLYYFHGPVVVADRIAITDAASLRAFESAHRAVWVYEPAVAAGPPSPDELPAALTDAPALVRSVRSGRLSQQQKCFRAALLKRDGAACVLCGLADDVGGKSCLEAAHVIALSTPARILDEIPLVNLFDTQNGIVLCADCHHWYDRHMWHVDADGKARVADALRHRVGCERWAAFHGRALRQPVPPLDVLWPLPRYWAVQQRLCLAAAAARAEVVAGHPFFCEACGARAKTEAGLRRHACGSDAHVFTPLLARVFPAAAAAAAAASGGSGSGVRELLFPQRGGEDDGEEAADEDGAS